MVRGKLVRCVDVYFMRVSRRRQSPRTSFDGCGGDTVMRHVLPIFPPFYVTCAVPPVASALLAALLCYGRGVRTVIGDLTGTRLLHCSRTGIATLVSVYALALLAPPLAAQELRLPNVADSVKFAAFGDTGDGEPAQFQVAEEMLKYHRSEE